MDMHRVPPPGSLRLLRKACWTLLLVPLVVSSTPPSLPPYHEYVVDGSITRTGGGTLEGFAIVLMYKRSAPTEWVRGTSPALTDASGHFQVRSGEFHLSTVDSLAPAMVNPDTLIIGTPFPTSEDPGYANESLHSGRDDGFFCDKDVTSWEVDGYTHYYENRILILP